MTKLIFTTEVEGKDVEVVASTEAKLSCVVHGLTRQLDLVRWESFEGEITDGTDGYEIDVGMMTQTVRQLC